MEYLPAILTLDKLIITANSCCQTKIFSKVQDDNAIHTVDFNLIKYLYAYQR